MCFQFDIFLKSDQSRWVLRKKRLTTFLLIFMFGFLSLRNLSDSIGDQDLGNCGEFGHIHFRKMIDQSAKEINSGLHSAPENREDGCHGGQVFASSFVLTVPPFELHVPVPLDLQKMNSKMENHFQSPFLELRRKPPRSA